MITINLKKDDKPDVLTKENKVDYLMTLTKLLEPNTFVDRELVSLAQDKIKQLIKEL